MPRKKEVDVVKEGATVVTLERPEKRPEDREGRVFLAKIDQMDLSHIKPVFDVVFQVYSQQESRIRYIFVAEKEAGKIGQLMQGLYNNKEVSFVFKDTNGKNGKKTQRKKRLN